jgi:hypothetical protein
MLQLSTRVLWLSVFALLLSAPACNSGGDDDATGDDDASPGDDDGTTGDDDSSAMGDDDGAGDDDASSGDDDATAGDDDATAGDDDSSLTGDDDVAGDDDVTAGDDDSTAGDDDSSPAGDDDATAGDDDTSSFSFEDCSDETREFWAWDLSVMPPRSVKVAATCRLTGPHAYLYVADDQWGETVTPEMAQAFMTTFEYRSGAAAVDPGLGIFDNDRMVFGDIPDTLDDDPRMYLLLLNIADYVNSEGETFSFDGYFNAYDELPDEEVKRQTLGLYRSNECEMLYINSRIRPVTEPYTLGVIAHELQHLIAYNYDTAEDVWMSESLAEVAMLVNGYYTDVAWVESYAADPSTPLVTTTASGSYGAYLLWGMYLYEQVGRDFMMTLEKEQQDGISGLNRALKTAGIDTDFPTLFQDWVVANGLQDRRVDIGQYGYDFSDDLPPMTPVAELTSSTGTYDGEVEAFGVDYLDISAVNTGSSLTISTEAGSSLVTQLIKRTSAEPEVVNIPSRQGSRSIELDGATGSTYTLVVTFTDTQQIDTGNTAAYSVAIKKK